MRQSSTSTELDSNFLKQRDRILKLCFVKLKQRDRKLKQSSTKLKQSFVKLKQRDRKLKQSFVSVELCYENINSCFMVWR